MDRVPDGSIGGSAPTSDGGASDGTGPPDAPEEVSLESLIAQPSAHAGRRVTTSGWVMSCREAIACGMPCDKCALCSSRATFVMPGTVQRAPCERNGKSLIIMDLVTLNKYVCGATACANDCERTCPFPAKTLVRLTGTIKHAEAESQIGLGEDQWVFVPDPN